MSFMSLATLIAAIAIVLDSQILVIGAMVLGPEFGAVAALGIALVRRRYSLLALAGRTLALGFLVSIAVTTLLALVGRALGGSPWRTWSAPSGHCVHLHPDKWSFIVAVIAAAAGVLSLTSARVGGLSGVFISVTTVPAAGNVALGLAFGAGHEIWGLAAAGGEPRGDGSRRLADAGAAAGGVVPGRGAAQPPRGPSARRE